MKTKIINDIEYLVYESGIILNDPKKSYYFENDLEYEGDVNCLHFYAIKNVVVGGNQDVRYIYLHLYCKYAIRLDRNSDAIKIGCVEKTESEWDQFFEQKQTINMSFEDRNYKKLESAFQCAKLMRVHLKVMNDK
jgi:hypothetical protein